jgi:hypothetical protein
MKGKYRGIFFIKYFPIMDAEVSTHTFLTMIIEESVCLMSCEPIFFFAIILMWYTEYICICFHQLKQQWRGRWTCTRICRFLIVGNIFRLETCMNSLVFQIEFSGKKIIHPKLVYYYFKSRLLWNYDYLRPPGYWPGRIYIYLEFSILFILM